MKSSVRALSGPKGKCEVRLLKKEVKIIDEENGQEYFVDYDFVSQGVVLNAGTDIYYELSTNEQWLRALRPWRGMHFIKFLRFAKKKEDPYAHPKMDKGGWRTGADGSRWFSKPYAKFTAVFVIANGKWKGTELIKTYEYSFEEDEEGQAMHVGYGKRGERFDDFLMVTGMMYKPLKYSPNVLPDLEKQILKNNAVFSALLENSWIDTLSEVPEGTTIPD